jgi:hypothetical protein
MENQRSVVDSIKNELYLLRTRKTALELQFKTEVEKLQKLCEVTGHHFDRHGGWDGHRNEFYYVCSICQFSTPYKPDKWEKDHSY